MKNSPFKIFLLVLAVVLLLIPMQWMPAMEVGNYEVKRVALLADVLPESGAPSVPTDSAPLPPPPPKPAQSVAKESKPHPKDIVPIEDYADADARGMAPLYKALRGLKQLNRPVRIAYFGDSFIEVDILTSALRNRLQQQFGGNGVGYLDMAPPYAANRPTVRQRYGGWQGVCVLDKGKYDRNRLGIGQRYFMPQQTAWTEICGVKQAHLDTTEVHTLYLRTSQPVKVGVKLNDGPMLALQTVGSGRVEALTHSGRSGRTRWQVSAGAGTVCWGVAEESRHGVIVDNFSLRGSSGITLNEVPATNLRELNAVRPYDLIVLQFGLNVANKKQINYSGYAGQMKRVVEHLKQSFPQAGILIIGVGDREDRLADGQLHTLPGIHALVRYQQNLASDCHVAFWNLYDAMGGEGSIRRMAEAHPAEAGKDYTHINAHGGKRIADFLFKSMIYGYQQYK